MSIRWTKRPQNYCGSCGHSWYPRGRYVAAACPRCGSSAVYTAATALVGLIVGLISLAFLPLVIALRLAAAILGGLLRLGAWTLGLAARGLVRIVPAAGRLAGSGAARLADVSARSFPPVRSAVGGVAGRLARHGCAAFLRGLRWVASAREDIAGDGDREVNPLALVAKLLVFAGACVVSLILVIDLVMLAAGPRA